MAPISKTVKVKVIPIVYMASGIRPLVVPSDLLSDLSPPHLSHFSHVGLLVACSRQVPASPDVPPPLPTSGLCSLVGFEVASYPVTQREIGPCSLYSCPLSLL